MVALCRTCVCSLSCQYWSSLERERKGSWAFKAVVETALFSCSVANWKWLLQRKREKSCFKTFFGHVILLFTCLRGATTQGVPMSWSRYMDWGFLPLKAVRVSKVFGAGQLSPQRRQWQGNQSSPPDGVRGCGYCHQWLKNSCPTGVSVRVREFCANNGAESNTISEWGLSDLCQQTVWPTLRGLMSQIPREGRSDYLSLLSKVTILFIFFLCYRFSSQCMFLVATMARSPSLSGKR